MCLGALVARPAAVDAEGAGGQGGAGGDSVDTTAVDDDAGSDTVTVVGFPEPFDPPLHAPSAAIIPAAEAAAFHALLMATPPSGGC